MDRASDLIHDEDHGRVEDHFAACLTDKLPFTIEYRLQKKWHSVDTVTGKEISGDTWCAQADTIWSFVTKIDETQGSGFSSCRSR